MFFNLTTTLTLLAALPLAIAINANVCSHGPYKAVTACSDYALASSFCDVQVNTRVRTTTVVVPGTSTTTKTARVTVTAPSTLTGTVPSTTRGTYPYTTSYATIYVNSDVDIPQPSGCNFNSFTRKYSDLVTLSTGCFCATGDRHTSTVTSTSTPSVVTTATITKYAHVVTSGTTTLTRKPFTLGVTRLDNLLTFNPTPCPQPTTLTTQVFEKTITYALYTGVFATRGPTATYTAYDLAFDVFQGTPRFDYCLSLCESGGTNDVNCQNIAWHPKKYPGCVIQYDIDAGSDYVCYNNPKFNSSIILGSEGGF